MKLRVSGADPAGQELDALIIPLARSETLPRGLRGLDAALGGAITRSLERGDFAGNPNELSALLGGEQAAKRIILIGLGDQKEVSEQTLRAATATAVREAARRKSRSAGLLVPPLRRIATPNAGQALTEGALLGSYRFDKYRTTEDKPTALESLELFMPDAARARALRQGIAIGTITAEADNLVVLACECFCCAPPVDAFADPAVTALFGPAPRWAWAATADLEAFGPGVWLLSTTNEDHEPGSTRDDPGREDPEEAPPQQPSGCAGEWCAERWKDAQEVEER